MIYKNTKRIADRLNRPHNFFAVVLVLAVVLISGCNRSIVGDDKKVLVESSPVATGRVHIDTSVAERIGLEKATATTVLFQPTIEVYGRIIPNPNATIEILSPSAGQISIADDGRLPMLGTNVAAGQLLAIVKVRISPEARADFETRIVEANSRLRNNEDIVDALSRITQGLQNIASKEILSRTELDSALANLARAKAQVALDKAIVANWQGIMERVNSQESKEGNFWRLPIQSLHAGTIAEVNVAAGAFVEAGMPLLKIIDPSQQLIRLDTPPAYSDLLSKKFKDEALKITYQGKSLDARFLGIAPSVDLSSQNIPLLFSVEDSSNCLRSGLQVTTRIPKSETSENAIKLPKSSVLQHRGMHYVYVEIEDETYQRRSVEVLDIRDSETLVKVANQVSHELAIGVQDGDLVVSKGAQLLLSREFLVSGGDDD